MNNDLRYEDWFWNGQSQEDHQEAERLRKGRQRRRHARWMKWARRVLLVELGIILFEGMYQFGNVIRGYNSFGGESLLLLALIGFLAWKLREILR